MANGMVLCNPKGYLCSTLLDCTHSSHQATSRRQDWGEICRACAHNFFFLSESNNKAGCISRHSD